VIDISAREPEELSDKVHKEIGNIVNLLETPMPNLFSYKQLFFHLCQDYFKELKIKNSIIIFGEEESIENMRVDPYTYSSLGLTTSDDGSLKNQIIIPLYDPFSKKDLEESPEKKLKRLKKPREQLAISFGKAVYELLIQGYLINKGFNTKKKRALIMDKDYGLRTEAYIRIQQFFSNNNELFSLNRTLIGNNKENIRANLERDVKSDSTVLSEIKKFTNYFERFSQ